MGNKFKNHLTIETLSDTANHELCKVANWLAANKLSLNVKKTHFVIYKAKNKKMSNNITINIGNQSIEQVNNTNFVGLNIDQDLSLKHHIKEVTSKTSKLSGIMIRARRHLPLKTLQMIYNALVYPYLTYCNVVWANTYPSRLEGIHKVQKKIVRIITFSKYLQETRPIFLSLGLLTIYELNTYLLALFMYSYFSGNLPSVFTDYFTTNNTIHMHNTRSVNSLYRKFNPHPTNIFYI